MLPFKKIFLYALLILWVGMQSACRHKSGNDTFDEQAILREFFGNNINLDALPNYANQSVPIYITRRNGSVPSDAKALLGRVLFYDKNLSVNNTISCANCHQQAFAFSDPNLASIGVNGTTGRHSMRLINAAFSVESRFFWDERAASLEQQTTQPIQDHTEMGFSGRDGNPSINDLLSKLENINYYQILFKKAYGDTKVTESRLQESLAAFVRSIQSFDSKFDIGRSQSPNNAAPFPNFTPQENQGKNLFLQAPQLDANGFRIGGGAGCGGCHNAPEFDIAPNSGNNGIIAAIGGGTDFAVTRSPTLRDLIKSDGTNNGAFMHNGFSSDLLAVVNHYNQIPASSVTGNPNLDPRLRPQGNPLRLQLTEAEKAALVTFMRTLSGNDVYSNPKWANPFIK